jgi:hypothetical protein
MGIDIGTILEQVQRLEKLFTEMPMDEVVHVQYEKSHSFHVWGEILDLKVLVTLVRGPRGGLTEFVVSYKGDEKIEADRLYGFRADSYAGILVNFFYLKLGLKQLGKKPSVEDIQRVCTEFLLKDFAKAKEKAQQTKNAIRGVEGINDGGQIFIWQGGLPTQGRHGGGDNR